MNDGYDDEYQVDELDEYEEGSSISSSNKKSKPHSSSKEKAGKAVDTTGKATSAVGKGTELAGKSMQAAGAGTELAGKGLKTAGNATSAAGDALLNAGKALSGTGVGAIAGVPMMAAGGAAKGAGGAAKTAGKGAEAAGKGMKNAGKKVDNAGKNINQKGKKISSNGKKIKGQGRKQTDSNPLSGRNHFRNFAGNINSSDPKLNSSKPILEGKKGFFGRGNNSPFPSLGSLLGRKRRTAQTEVKKTVSANPLQLFALLPTYVKIMIISSLIPPFLGLLVAIIIACMFTDSALGDREMKTKYIQGNYTDEEICDYLDSKGYINVESVDECKDTPQFKFFKKIKDKKETMEKDYSQNRFSVNVELLYETLSYYYADEEAITMATEDEIEELMEAMHEEIEETCVVKTYNTNTKVCTTTRYVYDLHEYSLNKYISYLKYGDTSTHPNYQGEKVKRKCGEGKNVDYVFGFGLVNTSSSPISESSNCPGNPVKEEDYTSTNVTEKKTSLEELDALGGVPYFSHVNKSGKTYESISDVVLSGNGGASSITVPGSGKGKEIAEYALQFVGKPYVYGGASLTGADCSGLVMATYAQFGVTLPHSANSISYMGTEVPCNESSLQPGDVIGYGNELDENGKITYAHVALYIGDGNVVTAMNEKLGIKVKKFTYSSRRYMTCRRFIN